MPASRHAHPIAPHHLERQFAVEEVEGADRVWVSFRHLRPYEGGLALPGGGTRPEEPLGGAVGDENTLDASLATDALTMALLRRRPARELMHHSDRGSCASMALRAACAGRETAGTTPWRRASSPRPGWELIEDSDWHTHEETKRDLFEYLEVWYNRRRRHSALGYKSPAEYEAELTLIPRAA
jgi:transposase InsO family protein